MASGFRLRFPADINKGDDTDSPTRRGLRNRSKPKKYGEFLELSPTKRKFPSEEISSEDENFHVEQDLQKPTALFSSDDVEGQDMFKFKSRHTKYDLQNMVKSAISNSPKLESPLRTAKRNLMKVSEATPKHVKDIIKKRIIREVDSDSGDSDFSGSSSDFVPDGSDQEESDGSDQSASEEETQEPDKPMEKQQLVRTRGGRARAKDSEYFVTPDNYFMMHSSKKITTSDHTLARIKNLNLEDNLDEEEIHISAEHKQKLLELNQSYEHLFHRWLYILSENFSIILYGLGSKRSILHQFQMNMLQNYPCIVINGYFPSLTIKSILETIVIDLLENTHVPSNIGDVVNLIETQLKECETELFLIINNIDGTMLRNTKAQNIIASISQISNVHTIASIDHINAPLLWDHSKLSKFKFTWWDVTTFLPYKEETSYENSLMTHRSGALQLSSLRSVYQSLTSNAKGIFNVIIEYQLDNQKQTHYQGLPFKDLYSKCREQFLVSSDLALRAQLTEFLDHKLVKMKRSYDGSENLIIPIENSLLQQFLEQQNS
ncbi:origin recognition complex subunit 2 [Plodia interpunctella]|uniref:origin recognition complex subunit 2 n=1 Tax=Plodia interpunctella TaxID=58824 RepID=UPI00236837E2|nr:origin recognition complex subunit 2 [Plodia interpunctella]XP_053603523.1 origin recognition complex subunit 2 [Plodia interpunctella]